MILEDPNPILNKVSPYTPWPKAVAMRKPLESEWKKYAAKHPDARVVGLSAPQIGKNYRVFLAFGELFINPTILNLYGSVIPTIEGCCSVDGVYQLKRRYPKVLIRWGEVTGRSRMQSFSDREAIIIQHEMDHLDGHLIREFGKLLEYSYEQQADNTTPEKKGRSTTRP